MKIKHIILCVLAAIAIWCAGWICRSLWPQKSPETPIIEKVDTLIVRDTITAYKAKFIDRRVVDTVKFAVFDTICQRDTLYVFLEREQIRWEDSLVCVYASGIRPEIDSVRHYLSSQIITKERIIEKKVPCRWGIGVQLGYGAAISGNKVVTSPYIGVGISYNIVSW